MDAVVFDFDGVLVQSMEQHAEAYRRILEPLGVTVAPRDVLLREGARSSTILHDLLSAAGIEVPAAELQRLSDAKQVLFRGLGIPTLYPGVVAMLEATWGSGRPTAVVTGTHRANLDAIIPDLAPRFDALVTQEDYTHDKPHPEPYLTAAAALGVDPSRCIAVENAVRGVRSARAAGYGTVMAITTTMTGSDLAEAEPDVLVADHAALQDALRIGLEVPA